MLFSFSVNRTIITLFDIWWRKDFTGGGENGTFGVFQKFLTPNTVHIDFGAWIDPTVLFAANIAKRVIAFECDPYAARELIANIRVNPYLSHKISVSSLCISDHIHSTKMTGHGGSGSTIKTVGKEHCSLIANITKTEWTVHCVPLLRVLVIQTYRIFKSLFKQFKMPKVNKRRSDSRHVNFRRYVESITSNETETFSSDEEEEEILINPKADIDHIDLSNESVLNDK
ncbi:unnamed protein product [Rotaria magnacalcarata]|uniref:Uncharacterized protein n=1 Tax=Rotaria magnacalcarata TaxID=392030 RepID=A0A817ACD2_9BILA|nr:unnamed protein product [Rotaria magnacalcarata]CAF3929656.1 unnamed protein product [Rotaria magnacalcarata]